ncbi:MAG: hypothetical protein LBJ41_03870 [Treponema sp.]|jgi:hypothetical protein|nr:hypothetical protein [Treponema sp.]
MKKTLCSIILIITVFCGCLSTPVYTGQDRNDTGHSFQVGQFSIPTNAELLESTEFKDNGITYMLEQRYRLQSGQIMYAYYDIEGSNSVTIQRMEENPLLTIGTDVNIPGMPGYREFNFGADSRKLVQFMKLFKLGQRNYRREVETPSLSDRVFSKVTASHRSDFKLLLDLYDETWVLEHLEMDGNRVVYSNTTAFFHTNR